MPIEEWEQAQRRLVQEYQRWGFREMPVPPPTPGRPRLDRPAPIFWAPIKMHYSPDPADWLPARRSKARTQSRRKVAAQTAEGPRLVSTPIEPEQAVATSLTQNMEHTPSPRRLRSPKAV